MKTIRSSFRIWAIIGGFIASLNLCHAQTIIRNVQATPANDTNIMSVLAQARALAAEEPVPEQSIPVTATEPSADNPPGTYWSLQNALPPLPFDLFPELPVYTLDPTNGVYLIDDRSVDFPALQAQAGAMVNRMMSLAGADFESGDAGASTAMYGSNDLWLEITGITNRQAYLNLHNATNQVYEIWSRTDLLATNWDIEQEVCPVLNQEPTPFTVPQMARTNLFIWGRDWTGIDENSNGIPDWWEWRYFGNFNQPTNGDYDSDGIDNLTEYLGGTDPNKIRFSLHFLNNHINTHIAYGTIVVSHGVPSYMASVINSTNFTDAVWQPYNSNLVISLDSGDGNYNVWIGLRGLPQDAYQTWQWTGLILDTIPPTIVVTNPSASVASQPLIVVQGYASESLSNLTFDVSNTAGILTNQIGYLTGQFYNTNLLAYTTNYFECPNIVLSPGPNIILLHATDWAGNTTNVSFTLDYSADTNLPVFTLTWPQGGTVISGNQFTLQGHVNDTTARITASIVDAGGNTNVIQGLIEQNGLVWVQNLPLADGANVLTITATNLAGSTSDSITVNKSSATVTLDALSDDRLNQATVNVIGTVSDPNCEVWVNGIRAFVDSNGTWEADDVPVTSGRTAIFDVEVYSASTVNYSHSNLRFNPADGNASGNNLGSQLFCKPKAVKIGLMSYSGSRYENWNIQWICGIGDSSAGAWESTVNWLYSSGGTFGFNSESYSLPGGEDAIFVPWEYASLTFFPSESTDCWSVNKMWENHTETRVMIEPQGQLAAGPTNLYLVRAKALEFSNPPYGFSFGAMFGRQYAGDVPLSPEWLQIKGQTLVNSGITNDDGSVIGEAIVSAPAGMNVDVTPTATQVHQYWNYTFDVQALDITRVMAVDNNRDGQIAFDGSDDTTPAKPFRFWINDSKEGGDIVSGADDQIPGASLPNCNLNHINGRSDLINFFPVALCLSSLMDWLSPTNGFEYHLVQNDGAVKFVHTTLAPANAFDCLTNTASFGYGTNFNGWATNADTIQVQNTPGTTLDTNWLAWVQNNGGNGVVLMEGCATTTQPLMLEIWRNGQKMGGVPLYISIGGVEQMYRWVNLRSVTGGAVSRESDTDEPPNNPDSLNPNGNFVFVHGYNVNESQARGGDAEVFKRLYQARSKAKFYAVTWNGSQSQGDYVSGVTANYQTNVVNAFVTAPFLKDFLSGLSGDTTLAGHSLGNMVCLSAINDWGAAPTRYFMIDGAVAMEAIDGNAAVNVNMIYPVWTNYVSQLYASKWYNLWPSSDARSTLTWDDRLANLGNTAVYNFYSSGEDVLRTHVGVPPSSLFTLFGRELVQWIEGQSGTYVWAWQEKDKGRMSGNSILSSNHGGWGFNDNALNPNSYTTYTVAMANAIPSSQLQTNAFFDFGWHTFGSNHPDYDHLQVTDAGGSDYAAANRNRILSDAIPALTPPIGANLVPDPGIVVQNFDMQSSFENGWPSTRGPVNVGNPAAGEWHHSDMYVVAYPFTYQLFNQLVTSGHLR